MRRGKVFFFEKKKQKAFCSSHLMGIRHRLGTAN
jgi:hypothetical protein